MSSENTHRRRPRPYSAKLHAGRSIEPGKFSKKMGRALSAIGFVVAVYAIFLSAQRIYTGFVWGLWDMLLVASLVSCVLGIQLGGNNLLSILAVVVVAFFLVSRTIGGVKHEFFEPSVESLSSRQTDWRSGLYADFEDI